MSCSPGPSCSLPFLPSSNLTNFLQTFLSHYNSSKRLLVALLRYYLHALHCHQTSFWLLLYYFLFMLTGRQYNSMGGSNNMWLYWNLKWGKCMDWKQTKKGFFILKYRIPCFHTGSPIHTLHWNSVSKRTIIALPPTFPKSNFTPIKTRWRPQVQVLWTNKTNSIPLAWQPGVFCSAHAPPCCSTSGHQLFRPSLPGSLDENDCHWKNVQHSLFFPSLCILHNQKTKGKVTAVNCHHITYRYETQQHRAEPSVKLITWHGCEYIVNK